MSCAVYVISSELGPVKIGIATKPKHRLAELKTSAPAPLKLEFIRECGSTTAARMIERAVHAKLAMANTNREWFSIPVREAIQAIADAAVALGIELLENLTDKPGKRGRPRGRTQDRPFMMRGNAEFYEQLDALREAWSDNPSRAEVIRRLVRGERPPGPKS